MKASPSVELFSANRHLQAVGLVSGDVVNLLRTYLHLLVDEGRTSPGDKQVPGAPAVHGAPAFEALLHELTPTASELLGMELLPNYSYARLYRRGDALPAHIDREACEISATVSLGSRKPHADSHWPIFLRDGDHGIEVRLAPGDALFYLGRELEHWRDPLPSAEHAQVFLHWVQESKGAAGAPPNPH